MAMVVLIYGSSAALIAWGLFLVLTGDYIATLDIAATLISAGVVSLGIATLTRTLSELPKQLVKPQQRPDYATTERLPADVPTSATDISSITKAIAQATAGSAVAEPLTAPLRSTAQPAAALPSLRVEPKPVADREPAPPAPVLPSNTFAVAPSVAPLVEPEQPQTPEREFLRESSIDGKTYRFYSDGSAECNTPQGPCYFASIDDVREAILASRTDAPQPVAETANVLDPQLERRDALPAEPSFAAAFSTHPVEPLASSESSFAEENENRQWVAALGLSSTPRTNTSPDDKNWPKNNADHSRLDISPRRTAPSIASNSLDESFNHLRLQNAASLQNNPNQEVVPQIYEDTGHIFPVERSTTALHTNAPSQPDHAENDEWAEPFRMLLNRERTGKSIGPSETE